MGAVKEGDNSAPAVPMPVPPAPASAEGKRWQSAPMPAKREPEIAIRRESCAKPESANRLCYLKRGNRLRNLTIANRLFVPDAPMAASAEGQRWKSTPEPEKRRIAEGKRWKSADDGERNDGENESFAIRLESSPEPESD